MKYNSSREQTEADGADTALITTSCALREELLWTGFVLVFCNEHPQDPCGLKLSTVPISFRTCVPGRSWSTLGAHLEQSIQLSFLLKEFSPCVVKSLCESN